MGLLSANVLDFLNQRIRVSSETFGKREVASKRRFHLLQQDARYLPVIRHEELEGFVEGFESTLDLPQLLSTNSKISQRHGEICLRAFRRMCSVSCDHFLVQLFCLLPVPQGCLNGAKIVQSCSETRSEGLWMFLSQR